MKQHREAWKPPPLLDKLKGPRADIELLCKLFLRHSELFPALLDKRQQPSDLPLYFFAALGWNPLQSS